MNARELLKQYSSAVLAEGLYPSEGNLIFHMRELFAGVDLNDKRMLDIGGGEGTHSFYAACTGARRVVCLEPEVEGSNTKMTDTFRRFQEQIPVTGVTLDTNTIQDFSTDTEQFDVVLLHNSINHLDEEACIKLHEDQSAGDSYRGVLSHIGDLCAPNATLIVCDCSPDNFFARVGMRNPFAPAIEWHKHQSPELWADLLGDVGFRDPRIRWTPLNRLRDAGKPFTGNRLAAFFLASHFCLKMTKTVSSP